MMADGTSAQRTPLVTRRTFLTGTAATAGVVVGSGVMMGVPTIWAQKLKDIALLHVGGSYSAIIDIARQATKDLGFKIDMQNAATDALVNRVATQPQSLDIADVEYWMPVKLLPRGVLQGIDLQRHAVGGGRVDLYQGAVPGRTPRVTARHFAVRGPVP
jgi:putative spermidine/putrescine transport system substrate-binding protein